MRPRPRHGVLLSPYFTDGAIEAFRLSQGYIPSAGIQNQAVSLDGSGFLYQHHRI